MFVVNALSLEATIVFVSLQGITTLVSEQRQSLDGLIDTCCRMYGIKGPPSTEQLDKIVAMQPS